jgi:hypothetical protein
MSIRDYRFEYSNQFKRLVLAFVISGAHFVSNAEKSGNINHMRVVYSERY